MSQPSHQSLVYRGALGVVDVWPLELTLESTEFLHSQTLGMGQHDWVLWQPFTGSERRSGFSSVVHKRTHYDGGREPEGLGGMGQGAFHCTLLEIIEYQYIRTLLGNLKVDQFITVGRPKKANLWIIC